MKKQNYANLKLPPEVLSALKEIASSEYMSMIAYLTKHVNEKLKEGGK